MRGALYMIIKSVFFLLIPEKERKSSTLWKTIKRRQIPGQTKSTIKIAMDIYQRKGIRALSGTFLRARGNFQAEIISFRGSHQKNRYKTST